MFESRPPDSFTQRCTNRLLSARGTPPSPLPSLPLLLPPHQLFLLAPLPSKPSQQLRKSTSVSHSTAAKRSYSLVIAATATPVGAASSTASGSSDDTPANAIGAVNQGLLSGAPALHKLSAPAVALTALVAALAVSL